MKRFTCLLVFALAVLVSPDSQSCTTFTLQKNGRIVYGRNLDWHADSGLICINARNVSKKALILQLKPRQSNPAEWTSQFGSVTFNSLGKEFPTGGMNEAGLVVDVMRLAETQFPKADDRPEIGVLQWTQYLLDTCRNINDVLATAAKVRISEDGFPPQHFLLADRNGKTAVIEFLEGRMSVHAGAALPYSVLANSTYEESEQYAARYLAPDGQEPLPRGRASLERFARAAAGVRSFSGSARKMVDYSFDILNSVNAGYELNRHSTVWSIVYDVTGRKIHFRTNGNRKVRSINMARLDFSNEKPARVWPVVADTKGDITRHSVPFSNEMNREIVVRQVTNPGVARIFGDMTPMVDLVAAYPEACAVRKP